MKSYSQIKQDLWVLEKLDNKRNGFFVDIGAFDGVELSNTLLLEEDYEWDGICLECNPKIVPTLKSARKAQVCDRPIWLEDGEQFYLHSESKDDPMLCYINQTKHDGVKLKESISINTLLEEYNAPSEIDYINLDIEGTELAVMQNFNFEKYDVKCWTIEHNLVQQNQASVNNFFNLVFVLLRNNYLVKWHDWDIFAVKDSMSPEYIINGNRVK